MIYFMWIDVNIKLLKKKIIDQIVRIKKLDSFFILSLFAFIIYLSISYTLLGHSLLRKQFPSFDDFSFNIFFWRRKSRRVASSILKTY